MTTINVPSSNVGSVQLNTVSTTNISSTVSTTTTTQNTTNITSTAVAKISQLGDKAYMYMRPKTIQFKAQGLKPNTRYYPFFNNVDVSGYCSTVDGQVTSELKTNSLGDLVGNFYLPAAKFLAGSHTFSLVDNIRQVGGVNIQDPLYGKVEAQYEANGVLKQLQTQVTVNSVVNTTNVTTSVSQVNTVAQNNVSQTVNVALAPVQVVVPPPPIECEGWFFEYADISSTTAKVFTVVNNSATAPSVADVKKEAGAAFANASSVIAGTIKFISTTSAGNNVWYHLYSVRGGKGGAPVIKVYRREWVGTTYDTPPDIETLRSTGIPSGYNRTITVPWTKMGTVACPVKRGLGSATLQIDTKAVYVHSDPIAQSFLIDASTYPEGTFVTSVTVYFKTVDQTTPVVLELRNMVDGYPGPNVFPGGRALIPGIYAAQSPDASVGTAFRFDFPVYLAPDNEYCFVLRSASLGYNVWCSKLGEVDVYSKRVIDTQPYLGTMFLSENNYTWIPDSTQDIKFDLYVAAFDTSLTGNVVLNVQKNSAGDNYFGTGQNLPLSYISTTKGSKVIKIKIPMHGLDNNDKIYIEGIATPTPATLYNNILAPNLNGLFTVTVVDEDHVQITANGDNVANITSYLNVKNEMNIIDNSSPIEVPVNPLTEAVPFINSDNFSPSTLQTAVTQTAPTPPTISTLSSFTVYTNIFVNEAMIDFMKTEFEQTEVRESITIASGKSTSGSETAYNNSTYNFVSTDVQDFYRFDTPRLIATPTNETLHSFDLQNKPSASVNVKLTSANKNVSPIIDTNGMSLMVRSYKIDNQNGELTGLTTQEDLNDSTLNSEIKPGTGNALAKYKSPIQITETDYNKINVFVVGNCPRPLQVGGEAAIDVYVRTSMDKETHADRDWTWVPLNGVYGTPFINSSSNTIMNEWMYEITLPQRFTVYDVKLVMRSTNNSVVPKIYSIRAITNLS